MVKSRLSILYIVLFLTALTLCGYLFPGSGVRQAIEVNAFGLDLIAVEDNTQQNNLDSAQYLARLDASPYLACRFPFYLASLPDASQELAQEKLSRCLQQGTSRPELVRLGLVQSLTSQGKNDEAADLLQTNGNLIPYFLNAANSAITRGDVDSALKTIELLAESGEYRSSVAYLRGKVYVDLANSAAAREAFETALAQNDYLATFTLASQYGTLYELGVIAASQRDWQLALESFAEAARLNPENPFVWMRLGLTYLNGYQGYARAEHAFNTSLRFGNLEWTHWGLGRIAQERSDLATALLEMLEAYAVSQNPRFLQDISAVLSAMSDEELAHTAFNMLSSYQAGDNSLYVMAVAII